MAIVHNLVVLARDLIEAELRPWENKHRMPMLQQVRRGLAKFLAQLGTPARPPNLAENPKAAQVYPAKRFPVVHKTAKMPQLVPT